LLYLTVMLIAFVLALAVQGMKGKPCDFSGIRLRKMWLAIVAFVLQTVTRILGIRGVESAVKFSFLIQAVVFVLLLSAFGSTENISVCGLSDLGFTECSGDACKRRKDAGKP